MTDDRTANDQSTEPRTRILLAIGIAVTLLGLAIGATFDPFAGGGVCMIGWVVLGYSLHKLGRLGRT